jgi:crotonobetainyl-CoA:carnitine CoA-transferase CaiB-like acyl-CoA transferase
MSVTDLRVIDMGQAVAGPFVATLLGDLGADVIKVERPAGDVYRIDRREKNGEPFNPPFELYNRNKRSLCVDVKTEDGREVLYDLVAEADVFVQNWPPGVAERLSLDYETLSDVNDDLVYTHVTGYGETGPLATNPAMDTIAQHVTGFSSLLGYDDDRPPIRSQSSLSDFFAGYNAAISTLAAVMQRGAGSGGQKIDVSLMESMMHNMDGAFEYYNNVGEVPQKGGRSGFFNPDMLYGGARAADGWICVALLLYSDRVWDAYCELLDRPDLREAEKYQSDDGRMADAAKLTAIFEEWLEEQPADEAIETLNEVGIPASRHNTVPEVTELDHVDARDIFVDVDHPRLGSLELTNTPLDLDEPEPEIRRHSPMLGEHNAEILGELGHSEADIDRLQEEGVLVSRRE